MSALLLAAGILVLLVRRLPVGQPSPAEPAGAGVRSPSGDNPVRSGQARGYTAPVPTERLMLLDGYGLVYRGYRSSRR